MAKDKKGKKKDKLLSLLRHTWILLFLVLTMAFSGYTDNLAIESQSLMQSHIYDYVYITHAEVSDFNGGSSNNFSFLDHEIRTDVSKYDLKFPSLYLKLTSIWSIKLVI